MKRTKIAALATLFCIAFSSCDAITGMKLTDQNSVDKMMPSKIEKHLDPETVVFQINYLTTSDFTQSMDVATIEYWDASESKVKQMNLQLTGNAKPRDAAPTFRHREKSDENGVKLKDIDFSQIASNIAKAEAMLAEISEGTGEQLSFDGIEYYRIILSSDPAQIQHDFRLASKIDTEMSTKRGKLEHITNYYELDFVADVAGNVSYEE